jgi:predicted pyridoxine 5'-phosphate oxidase superfamily flavin-nucleotide-binding protein
MRLNGRALSGDGRTAIVTEQVYSNCPKYITRREVEALVAVEAASPRVTGPALDARAVQLLAGADTAFVATRGPDGLDVSHRGGNPGFLRAVDAHTLVWPDYPGNRMFNTLGNIATDGRCGVTVADPEDGTTLYVSGRASILWDEERAVQLHVDAVVRLDRAAPLRWRAIDPGLRR